ncbi:MAG TPA: glycosyltransferase [Ignavibacteriales bacterium]|nr:glycosyltransferase [Ignavibacteriales bacterium]HOM64533.1 glycosyltransferase [Ignavibacteriales bacterium]HPD66630.1 glycosyltransferase [Ignavibacteriales bacterium]HRR17590.1 glycosyltransferase [Ignavibacteriales bacterium]HRT98080.1 glycosyltransferase [Ignavibacteriales bacterium]
MKQLKVIAIVVTYNRDNYLKELLTSLLNQTVKPNGLIIVDNNNSKMINESLNDENIIYIKNNANLGGSGGFTIGIKKALELKPDYLWLFDDDVFPKENALEELIKNIKPKTILQPVRMSLDSKLVESTCLKFNLSNPFKNNPRELIISQIYNYENLPEKKELNDFTFEGVLLPFKLVEDIGFVNNNFFIFCDDTDYAIRAINAGYKIFLIKNSIIYRQLPLQTQITDWKEYYLNRNMYYIYKNYGKNLLIKLKPELHSFSKILYLLLTFQFKRIKKVFYAYIDYKLKKFPIRFL